VWPKEWKFVRRYATGGRAGAPLDTEDIDSDIYKQASKMMQLNGMKMLPQQEVQAGGVHLWQLKRQVTSIDIRKSERLFRNLAATQFEENCVATIIIEF
jgi:hypothetical protein